ncbi:16S rRNA (adenine(1518)-N(6)/adenine(1519)-N(6))-dimethyltransferase RsmA [bacterium]|nr:16S rRNA (adenine(1518)-N(6)/adenine(1519)-N(6))-dimethyltransferase RsmA [bacterium]
MSIEFSPSGNIKKTLENAGISAKKTLGQNFLHDNNIIQKMISFGGINKKDTVLEIGPGLGTITKPLSEKAKKVIAIEIDKGVACWLSETMKEKGINNVEVIAGDAIEQLKSENSELKRILPKNYKVVANIPYYLTSHLIRLLLESDYKPETITLMIQKEVAERICNKKNGSLLSISVAFYADAKINFTVSKNCFHPKPKIDSSIISLFPRKINYSKEFSKLFFIILKAGFSSPRKQLLKNLTMIGDRERIEAILKNSDIEGSRRAETLSLDNWITITKNYQKLFT